MKINLTYKITQGYGFYAITKKLLNALTSPLSDIIFFLNSAGFSVHSMKPVYVKITESIRKNHV